MLKLWKFGDNTFKALKTLKFLSILRLPPFEKLKTWQLKTSLNSKRLKFKLILINNFLKTKELEVLSFTLHSSENIK